MVLRDHATKVSIQLLNVNAHKIAIINSELESKHMG
jgi:hypothetical protein